MRTYVIGLPRGGHPLFEGGRDACLQFIRRQSSSATARLGLVVAVEPSAGGPDALVCVPATSFASWEDRAAEVVEAWERRWCLIESMARRHRDEARAELHGVVASALLAAAIVGVDPIGAPDDLVL